MSEEERLIRLEELKFKLRSMPVKAILAVAITYFLSKSDVMSDFTIFEYIICFALFYSLLETVHYCAMQTGNWILGFILMIVIVVVFSFISEAGGIWKAISDIVYFMIILGGFVMDIFRIIQYVRLSLKKGEGEQ